MTVLHILHLLTLLTFLPLVSFAAKNQEFVAAKKHESLRRRDGNLEPRHDGQTLMYADGDLNAARVELQPKLPMLILEDVDEQIRDVKCNESGLLIEFWDTTSCIAATEVWGHQPFVLVTNSFSCQPAGEHTAWEIITLNPTRQGNTIALMATRTTLREATHRMTVEIGTDLLVHLDRRHTFPRQISSASVTSTNLATASIAPTMTFSYSSPTATATGASLSQDVSFSKQNLTLIPPDLSIASFLPTPNIFDNVRLSCVDCTMTGNIGLIAGGFSLESSSFDAIVDFFDDGYLEFDATGISANMEFELAFLPGFSVLSFVPQLPSIPLGAITITGILELGPVLDLTFPTELALGSPVTFRAGFTLTAPPSVKIYLNVSDPGSSYTTGFSETELNALPFTANAENLTFTFTTGFKPQLVLAAGVGSQAIDISAGGGIGVYLDMPMLSASLESLTGVDEKCESSSNGQDAMRLSQSVTYGGGTQWDLEVSVGLDFEEKNSTLFISTTTDLPGQCLVWDAAQNSLVNATARKSDKGSSSDSGGRDGSAVSGAGLSRSLVSTVCLIALTVGMTLL